jgi:hypothetical protein
VHVLAFFEVLVFLMLSGWVWVYGYGVVAIESNHNLFACLGYMGVTLVACGFGLPWFLERIKPD